MIFQFVWLLHMGKLPFCCKTKVHLVPVTNLPQCGTPHKFIIEFFKGTLKPLHLCTALLLHVGICMYMWSPLTVEQWWQFHYQ